MKIEEAADKMCCNKEGCGCCANLCMAWRWKIEPKQIDVGRTTFGEPTFDTQYVLSTTDGYCGLAGEEGAE